MTHAARVWRTWGWILIIVLVITQVLARTRLGDLGDWLTFDGNPILRHNRYDFGRVGLIATSLTLIPFLGVAIRHLLRSRGDRWYERLPELRRVRPESRPAREPSLGLWIVFGFVLLPLVSYWFHVDRFMAGVTCEQGQEVHKAWCGHLLGIRRGDTSALASWCIGAQPPSTYCLDQTSVRHTYGQRWSYWPLVEPWTYVVVGLVSIALAAILVWTLVVDPRSSSSLRRLRRAVRLFDMRSLALGDIGERWRRHGAHSRQVFISYSHANRDLARAMADELRRLDIEVWKDDEGRILAGHDFVAAMRDGVARSRLVVALVTEEFQRSSWARRELHTALLVEEMGQRDASVVVPVECGDPSWPVARWLPEFEHRRVIPGNSLPAVAVEVRQLLDDLGQQAPTDP